MKKSTSILTAAALLFVLTGCQASSQSSNQAPKNAPIAISYPLTLQAGYSTAPDDPRGTALEIFQNIVEEQTNGNILVELHPSGELGSDAELIQKMKY